MLQQKLFVDLCKSENPDSSDSTLAILLMCGRLDNIAVKMMSFSSIQVIRQLCMSTRAKVERLK